MRQYQAPVAHIARHIPGMHIRIFIGTPLLEAVEIVCRAQMATVIHS